MKLTFWSLSFLLFVVAFSVSAMRFTAEWKPHFESIPPDFYFPFVVLVFLTIPFCLGYMARRSEE